MEIVFGAKNQAIIELAYLYDEQPLPIDGYKYLTLEVGLFHVRCNVPS